MNVTRSEKFILFLLSTNAICAFGWANSKYDLFKDGANDYRQYKIAESYDSSISVKKLNEELYELQRKDGVTGIVDATGSYVIYGEKLSIDQVKWHNGLPEAIWSMYSSTGSNGIVKSDGEVNLVNFGTFKSSTNLPAHEKITQQVIQGNQRSYLPRQIETVKAETTPTPEVTHRSAQNTVSINSAKRINGLIPNTDCSIHYCKEGDKRAYPLPNKLLYELAALGKAKQLPHFEWDGKQPVDLAVIWDPTCQFCKAFYRNTLRQLLQDGRNVRFMISTNEPFDKIPANKKRLINELLCDASPKKVLLKQVLNLPYAPQPIPNCDAMPKVQAFKSTLAKYGFDGPTPVSFTSSTMLYGADFTYDEMYRYLP